MNKLKKLAKEFKDFISRGNVIDMAVAVIIGAAFNAIVTTLTNNIIKPLINWAVGGDDGIGLITMLRPAYVAGADGAQIVDLANSIYIDWGLFIMKVIDFLITALVLFIIIKVFMSLKNAAKTAGDKAKAKMTKKLKKQGLSEEEAKAQAEAQIAAEAAAAAPAAPTTEELLLQIRDLLAAQQNAAVPAKTESEGEKQ